MNLLDIRLPRLIREIPGAAAIFYRYDLSPCCDGKKTLKEAILDVQLDDDEVVSSWLQLKDQPAGAEDWNRASNQEPIALDLVLKSFKADLQQYVRLELEDILFARNSLSTEAAHGQLL